MSEDGIDDQPPAEAPPEAPVPEPAALPPPRRWPRVVVLGVVAVVVVTAAVIVLVRGRHRTPVPVVAGQGDGGAAIHAPRPPTVLPPGVSGVRLTGFVVDGAGLPVAGAGVTAELEKRPPDKALARPAIVDAGVVDAA